MVFGFRPESRSPSTGFPSERRNLKKHILTLDNTGSTVLSATEATTWKRAVQKVEETLSNLPNQWIEVSHRVSPDPVCMARAQVRLAGGIAPGKRGSKNIGDCIIAEHLLEMAASLRQARFTESFLFVSSNVKDFGRGDLKSPLDAQFAAADIEYLPHIEAAMVLLDIE
jgi:hypothetical protein